ncbi:MAG: S41 family peptidase [Chloroflexota bacterium]
MSRFLLIFFLFLSCYSLQAETKLLRYPHAVGETVVFSYAGDIYSVPVTGGVARKLTSSPGLEYFPRLSADGGQIAFSGEYDGNREIYVMSSLGGEPRRLTYSMDLPALPERMGPDKIIMQWSADGKEIIYRGREDSWNSLVGKLYAVPLDGGLPKQLPISKSGFASFSPDGSKMAFNRIFREYRTWKRYKGGQADDVWIYDFNTKDLKNVASSPSQDIIPVWAGNKIYFVSERTQPANLFSYDLATGETKQVTDFKEYDVKFPSGSKDFVAFENGGEIYLIRVSDGSMSKVPVEIADEKVWMRDKIEKVKGNIESYSISPEGARAVFAARGEIFTAPAEKGNIRRITNAPGAHDRAPAWSPKKDYIAFISDRTGEDEIYLVKGDGTDLIQLTNDAESYRYGLEWSPDGQKILCSDKAMKLYFYDVLTKKRTDVARSKVWEIMDVAWSPDSKWIAYSDAAENLVQTIYLYSLETGKTTAVTSNFFESQSPAFSKDGNYLFFTSNRSLTPTVGAFEYNYSFPDITQVFGVTLKKDLQSPYTKFESDESAPEVKEKPAEGEDEEKPDKNEKKTKKAAKPDPTKEIKIDLEGISERIFELPLPPGNYYGLEASEKKLFYVRSSLGKSPTLYAFDFESKKEDEQTQIGGFEISSDGSKILYSRNGEYYIQKTSGKIDGRDGRLDLSTMEMLVDRRQEWNQIYDETWRQMKYFFYDPNMHGVDWKGIHDKYAKLLPYVAHRADLTYLLGEMIGELNIGHAYVGGGDLDRPEQVPIGLLGAEFSYDNSGAYKITKIYDGSNWEERTRSPFTEPGVEVNVGQYVLEIDGVKLTKDVTPYAALVGKAGRYVALKVNSSAREQGSRIVNVKTIRSEEGLIYSDWVESARRKVDSATNGRVGYIHIPDMGFDNGLIEFVKAFYPQLRKEALIIDDRYNGGGNVSPLILERLRRELQIAKVARNQQVVTSNPDAVFTGPMICIINELSMSDGDLFPYQFKQAGLGKVIGKRSWGGVIGIRGSLPFVDGGYLYKPEFANFGREGNWILEGVGMTPDIEVDNRPDREYQGYDDQLAKAIELIMEDIKTDKRPKLPSVPPYPIKK